MNEHYRQALINELLDTYSDATCEEVETLVDGSEDLTGDFNLDIDELCTEWEEYKKRQPVEEMISTLKVGFNVTPFGFGFVKDEEDLEALKTWIRQTLLD